MSAIPEEITPLTLERVQKAIDTVNRYDIHRGTKEYAEQVHAELTRVEPEYVLSEKIAAHLYRELGGGLFGALSPSIRAGYRRALDAVARDMVTELAERAVTRDGVYVNDSTAPLYRSTMITLLCRGLPEGDKP